MDLNEQHEWMDRHIPHRVRAAIALSNMENSLLRVQPFILPQLQTDADKLFWRCATDSIWEGRLAATRWLIEFVGVRMSRKGTPARCDKSFPEDVLIDDFNGGSLLGYSTDEGKLIANVWKGCSQASSHATNAYSHSPVNDKERCEALKIILDHLQSTIYKAAGKKMRDYWSCQKRQFKKIVVSRVE